MSFFNVTMACLAEIFGDFSLPEKTSSKTL